MMRDDFNTALGKQIRQFRKKANITLAGLGQNRVIALSGTSIANIEAGRQQITIYQLYCIAFALGISVGDLLSGLSGPDQTHIPSSQKMRKIINKL